MTVWNAFMLTLMCWFGVAGATYAEQIPRTLLLVGQTPQEAEFVGLADDRAIQFLMGNRMELVPQDDLMRWSTVPTTTDRSEVLLNDSSKLMLANSWRVALPVELKDKEVEIVTQHSENVRFARRKLRGILFVPHARLAPQSQSTWNELLASTTGNDQLLLTNGDVLTGELLSIQAEDSEESILQFLLQDEVNVSIASDQVLGVVCQQSKDDRSHAKIAIGLQDGSLLMSEAMTPAGSRLDFLTASSVTITGVETDRVAYLQSLTGSCRYLSDMTEQAYQHTPYFSLQWDYERDKNVLGKPLTVNGRTYLKGLGMHTASRLTFSLQDVDGRYERFAAEVALDDAAEDGGSVIFEVHLLEGEDWQLAYRSPEVRGGQEPLPVELPLGGASRIALAVDFADHGDQRDYANWLDARLE